MASDKDENRMSPQSTGLPASKNSTMLSSRCFQNKMTKPQRRRAKFLTAVVNVILDCSADGTAMVDPDKTLINNSNHLCLVLHVCGRAAIAFVLL